jgi:quercetin dioxygenase-like cupin family protein
VRNLFSRLTVRLGLDAAMILLFVTSLAFRMTGRVAHEWIGLFLGILFCAHTVLNLGWYMGIFKGNYSIRRILITSTNLALIIIMMVLCVTGILNSRHIFGFSQYFDGESIRQIHSIAAYWGLVLIGVHIGLHWEMILAALRVTSRKMLEGKTAAYVLRIVAALVAVYGVWSSLDRDMGAKLFLGFSFDFWNPDRPLALFFTHNLSIIGLYAVIAHFAQKGVKHLSQRACMKMLLCAIATLFLTAGAGFYGGQAMAEENKRTQTIMRTGEQSAIKGSSEFFTGKVTIKPLFGPKHPDAPFGAAYVTFEPGARSFWHTHPAGQHLIVTDGVGRTGTADGEVQEFQPGDALWCPAGKNIGTAHRPQRP